MAVSRHTRLRSRLAQGVAFLALAAGLAVTSAPTDQASASANTVSFYLSAPGVEGPLPLSDVTIETFSAYDSVTWPGSSISQGAVLAVGTVSALSQPGALNGYFGGQGASTTSAQVVAWNRGGGSGVVALGGSRHATITLNTPRNYVGFLWMQGDGGNTVKLLSNGQTLATFTTADVVSLIPRSPTGATVSAINGGSYLNLDYWASRFFPSTQPANFPDAHAFINIVAPAGISFDQIRLEQNGGCCFEFDNLSVANYSGTFDATGLVGIPATNSQVPTLTPTSKTVTFDANHSGSSSVTQSSLTGVTAPLQANTFTRAGYTFAGWSITTSGTVDYTDGANYSFATDLTLYALWTAIPSTSTPSPSIEYVPPPPPLPRPERVGDTQAENASLAMSQTFFTPGVDVVYLATEDTYADALVAGPRAGTDGGPIILTDPVRMTKPVADELIRLRPATIVVVGQTNAVGPDVEAAARFLAPNVIRVGGVDRYETAVHMSRRLTPSTNQTATNQTSKVYIASGEDFADAVTSGPIASLDGAPILLTRRNSIPAVTRAELAALDPAEIAIIGGPAAVSTTVETELRTLADTVTRIGGDNRYTTAARLTADRLDTGVDTVFLAVGEQFHHAVIAAPIATTKRTTVLLVQPKCVPLATRNQLDRLRPNKIIVIGADTTNTQRILDLAVC